MNRVEVLDEVGVLLLLPNTELATTKQVAGFYQVDRETINKLIQRNRDELEENGAKVMPHREIKALVNEDKLSPYKISVANGANRFFSSVVKGIITLH